MHGIQRDCPHFLRQVIHIVHHVIHNHTIFGALSLCITCGRRGPVCIRRFFIQRRPRYSGAGQRQDGGSAAGRWRDGAGRRRDGGGAAGGGFAAGRGSAAPKGGAARDRDEGPARPGSGRARVENGWKPVDGRRSAAPDGRCRRVVPEGVYSAAARPGFRGRNRGAARAVVLSAARARPVGGQRRGDGAPARYTARSRLCSSMSSLSATRAMNSPLVGLSFLP